MAELHDGHVGRDDAASVRSGISRKESEGRRREGGSERLNNARSTKEEDSNPLKEEGQYINGPGMRR